MDIYPDFQSAYVSMLGALRQRGRDVEPVRDRTSVGSGFGACARRTREILAHGFSISDPRNRLILSRARPVDIGFLLANVLWTCSGQRSVEMIAAYNSRGRMFTSDGRQLEAAFGARLFGSTRAHFFQAIRKLTDDPSSRRALVALYENGDLESSPKDTPCGLGVQYFIRDGRLDALTYMRSQSAAMVMPYDVALFTMLQEIAACFLGIPLGVYHHMCGSFHYYVDEQKVVDEVLCEQLPSPEPMPAMDSISPNTLTTVLRIESAIRENASTLSTESLVALANSAEPYWRPILIAMAARLHARLGIDNSWTRAHLGKPYIDFLQNPNPTHEPRAESALQASPA